MKEDDKEYIRAFAAIFAMHKLLRVGNEGENVLDLAQRVADNSVTYADYLMQELDLEPEIVKMEREQARLEEIGIAAIKPKKKYERKA